MNKKMQERSKYLSYILRHKPEEVKSKLDEYGWLPVKDLLGNSDFTEEELRGTLCRKILDMNFQVICQ